MHKRLVVKNTCLLRKMRRAEAIDAIPVIKYWIRNFVLRGKESFSLVLAHGRFFPNFICELEDG